jgi:glycerol uptake facilitator-like aquaporin
MPATLKESVINGPELLTEFTATFAFVSAVVASGGNPIVAGIALAIVIYLGKWFGDRADHVNPAITLGFLVAGKVGVLRGSALIATQVLAGILATLGVLLFMKR